LNGTVRVQNMKNVQTVIRKHRINNHGRNLH
jgi:hypothetical protein